VSAERPTKRKLELSGDGPATFTVTPSPAGVGVTIRELAGVSAWPRPVWAILSAIRLIALFRLEMNAKPDCAKLRSGVHVIDQAIKTRSMMNAKY
jgi:hypothetical protein